MNEIERNEVKLTSEIRQFSSPLNRPLSTALSEPQADFLPIFFLTLERSRCALDIFLLSLIVGTYEATDLGCLHPSREGSLESCFRWEDLFHLTQEIGPLTEPTPVLGTHRSIPERVARLPDVYHTNPATTPFLHSSSQLLTS